MKRSSFLSTAIKAIRASSTVIMRCYRSPQLKKRNKALKGKYDWVTTADIEAENTIIKIIHARFPNHNIHAEESGIHDRGSDYTWYIDPLSSTQNFVHGIPHFGSVVGLAHKNEPLVGAVADPYYHDIFFAEKGKGAWHEGKRLHVSRITSLDRAVLTASRGKNLNEGSTGRRRWDRIFVSLTAACEVFRAIGSNGVQLAWLAGGKIDGFVNRNVDIHSLVGSFVIVQEAGARITTLEGKQWHIHSPSVVISNGLIHRQLLRLIEMPRESYVSSHG